MSLSRYASDAAFAAMIDRQDMSVIADLGGTWQQPAALPKPTAKPLPPPVPPREAAAMLEALKK